MCLVSACALLLVGVFLWFDNPTVDVGASDLGSRGPAGDVGCSIAPWDAGLNGNRDGPGGEHSDSYSDEVAAECYAASTTRFHAALGIGVLAVFVLGVGAALAGSRVRPSG